MNKFLLILAFVLIAMFVFVQPALAVTDITAITTAFADATTGVGAIAAVMLGVVAAGIAVKWVLGFIIS